MPKERRIVTVQGADSAGLQVFLTETAANCQTAGRAAIGVIAQGNGSPDRTCTAGFLRDIGSGERFQIHLDEPPTDTTCDLDAGGVDAACATVMDQIATGDLVILSKFGKLEAQGRGLFPAFEAAIARGLPVVTTVSPKHREAWRAFAPDATPVEADRAAIAEWLSRHV